MNNVIRIATVLMLSAEPVFASQFACKDVFGPRSESTQDTVADSSGQRRTRRPRNRQEEPAAPRAKTRAQRIQEANQKLAVLRGELDNVKTRIKRELVGMDALVDQVAQRIYLIWEAQANMRSIEAPSVIPLMGFSGVGKTDVVNKFSSYLKMNSVFARETLQDGATHIPYEKLFARGRPESAAADGDPGEIRLGLDFFFMIDEIQKLMPFDRRQELVTAANRSVPDAQKDYDKVQRDQIAIRQITDAETKWWQILGDGSVPDTTASPMEHLRNLGRLVPGLDSLNKQLVQARTNLRKQQEKEGITPEELQPYQEAVTQVDTQIRQYRMQAEDTVEEMRKISVASFGRLASLSDSDLVDMAVRDFRVFNNTIKKNFEETAGRTVMRQFGYGIVFVAGNPEKIIENHIRTATDSSGRTDPTLLRRLTEQTPAKMMEEFFVSIFGNTQAGWRTRWNFDQGWRMLLPLSERNWKSLVRSRIQEKIDIVRAQAKLLIGGKVEATIDDSLVDMLYLSELDVRGGGRQTKKNLDRVLSDLSAQLPEELQKHRQAGNWRTRGNTVQLVLRADAERATIIIEENTQAQTKFRTEVRLTPTRAATNVTQKDTPLERVQMAVYQASRIVVGSALLRSLPRGSVEIAPTAVETVDALWAKPDVTQLNYLRSKLAVALSGYVGERLLIGNSGVVNTKYAELDLEFVKTTIGEIKTELGRLETLARARQGDEGQINIDNLIVGSLSQDRILRSIYENNEAAVYRELDRQVEGVITSQTMLMHALTAEFTKKPYLTPEKIQELFRTYANQRPQANFSFFRQKFARVIAWVRGNPPPAKQVDIDLIQLFQQEAGTIENPLQSLTHTPTPPQPRESFMDRLIRQIRSGLIL